MDPELTATRVLEGTSSVGAQWAAKTPALQCHSSQRTWNSGQEHSSVSPIALSLGKPGLFFPGHVCASHRSVVVWWHLCLVKNSILSPPSETKESRDFSRGWIWKAGVTTLRCGTTLYTESQAAIPTSSSSDGARRVWRCSVIRLTARIEEIVEWTRTFLNMVLPNLVQMQNGSSPFFWGGDLLLWLSEAELYKTGLLSFDLFLEQVFKQCRNDFKSLFTFWLFLVSGP